MIKNTIQQSVRTLFRDKKHSFITVLGLSLSLIALFHIYSFINYESNYDAFNTKENRIYRINGDIVAAENTMTHALVGPLLGPGLRQVFPGVESYVRLRPFNKSIFLERDNNKYEQEEAYTVDSTIFNIFSFHFIYGTAANALINPNEVVINESLSRKIFGDRNPVGEVLKFNNNDIKIVGVIEDSPQNAHHKLNVLFSFDDRWRNTEITTNAETSELYWMPSVYTFILLDKNENIKNITDNFEGFYEKYMSPFGNAIHAKFTPVPVSLKNLHFSRHMSYDNPKGNRTYSYIFLVIGLFILIVAFINYSNLLIFHLYSDSKNLTIKGILGAKSLHIYLQIFIQSTAIIVISLLIALPLYYTSIPFINELTGIHYSHQGVLLFATILFASLAIGSSIIPFFLHRKINSGRSFKLINPTRQGFNKAGSISVIAQFTLSIILLIVTFFMGRQIDGLTKQNMGFEHDNVLLLTLDNNTDKESSNYQSLKDELLKLPSVSQVAYSTHVPGENMMSFHFQIKKEDKEVTKIVNGIAIDYDYLSLMNMKLSYGRNFMKSFHDDNHNSIIVNEAFVNYCGFKGDITGEKIEESTIIGVVKDFCFNSLRNDIEPVVFFIEKRNSGYLNIKLKDNTKLSSATESINKEWKAFYPDMPCKLDFMDNRIKMMYKDDQTKKSLIQLFMLVSYLISISGLFNLSILMATRRTKEIGVRKVNGARILEIIKMLNADFVKWISLSFLLAVPVSYYIVHKWLETFAFKTDLSWWVFALSGAMTLLIAIIAVTWQSWKAARKNPVEALRYE